MMGAKVEYTVYIKVTGYICELYQGHYEYFTGIALTQPKIYIVANSLSTEIPKSFKERLTVLKNILLHCCVSEFTKRTGSHVGCLVVLFRKADAMLCSDWQPDVMSKHSEQSSKDLPFVWEKYN